MSFRRKEVKEEEQQQERRVNEEKAYYQKTDGPPFHSGPSETRADHCVPPPGVGGGGAYTQLMSMCD